MRDAENALGALRCNMKYIAAVQTLKTRLHTHYGNALDRVIIFGSVARHATRAGSDIDVMVVLDLSDIPVSWHTEREVRTLALPVELEHDVVFDLKVVDKAALSGLRGHTPFMERVLAEGVEV